MKNTLIAMAAMAALAPAPSAHGADALATDMFRCVVAEQKEGNVVFSPASVEAVLHILREGAAGDTLTEFNALPYGKQEVASAMRVECANALFAADDIRLKPLGVEDIRRVSFANAPAEAANAINAWCSEKTHELITSIVSPPDLTPNTRLIALNAVYLKEKWQHPFKATDTAPRTFTPADGVKIETPTMAATSSFKYAEGEGWQAVALPYRPQQQGEQGYFIAILPSGDAREFVAQADAERIAAICSALNKAAAEPTEVHLPIFRVKTPIFNLNTVLQAQGLCKPFTGEADFSGFTDEPLWLSEVRQRCFVQVDEEGTEAAAATAGIMMFKSLPRRPVMPHVIHLNRPFIWMIGDLTSDAPPYFMGLMADPR